MCSAPLTSSDLLAISDCLVHGMPIYVDGQNQVHPYLSGFDRFCYSIGKLCFSRSHESEKRLADLLIQMIEHDANKTVMRVCKLFCQKTCLTTEEVLQRLKLHLSAAKLGLPVEALEAFPSFERFAQISHLHHSLAYFNHGVDWDGKEIRILFQNQMTCWSAIEKSIKYENEKWCGHYSQNGIETKSLFEWKKLTACMSGDPSQWNHQYVFQFVIWHREKSENPSATGVHTYCHLLTPDKTNNIYSFGFYRPDKRNDLASLMNPLRIRKGDIQSPDESDTWNGAFSTLSVAITKEQFEAVKDAVEKDHRNPQPYQLTHHNCNEYTLKLARLCGIHFSSFLPISHLVFPKIPSPLRKVADKTTSIAINILGLFCAGSTKIDRDAPKGSLPHIRSLWDLLDSDKALFSHPYLLEKAFQEIEDWRKNQIKLYPDKKDVFAYAIPDKYKRDPSLVESDDAP